MNIIRKHETEIIPMSQERAEQIKALLDEEIDYSDIPELDEEFFKNAEPVEYFPNHETESNKVSFS